MNGTNDPLRMDPAHARVELDWLASASAPADRETGFAPDGWRAETWVLHAMFHDPTSADERTHDEVHRHDGARGATDRLVIAGVDLDEGSVLTGRQHTVATPPPAPWQWLRWSAYLHESGRSIHAAHRYPPSYSWFPPGSFPYRIQPPPEGSLDAVSWSALLAVLASHDEANNESYAYFGSLARWDWDGVELWRGQTATWKDIASISGHAVTPTNLWAADRSWFVWTDYDLLGTRVSGTPELVNELTRHPELETVTWQQPHDRAAGDVQPDRPGG